MRSFECLSTIDRMFLNASARMHSLQVTSVAFSKDGKWFIVGGKDHQAVIYRATSGKKLATIKRRREVRFCEAAVKIVHFLVEVLRVSRLSLSISHVFLYVGAGHSLDTGDVSRIFPGS